MTNFIGKYKTLLELDNHKTGGVEIQPLVFYLSDVKYYYRYPQEDEKERTMIVMNDSEKFVVLESFNKFDRAKEDFDKKSFLNIFKSN